MTEIIVVWDRESRHAERIKSAVNSVNICQRYFFLRIREEMEITPLPDGTVKGKEIATRISEKFSEEKVIFITDRQFNDNWFSHVYRHCAVISTFVWEQRYAPPSLRAYLVYQIAQALVPIEADITEAMLIKFVHQAPIGCLHDMNIKKSDIKYGMIAGNMCFDCEGSFRQYGVYPAAIDAIRRIANTVRDESIGRNSLVRPSSAFVIMRFDKNSENANAFAHGIEPGLRAVGLTPHRADDTVQSGQILTKILECLERSRFIVAKVDEENLNVYFELGLAMGLDKDVLLISESTLLMNLPSDLRNWECLTYDRGNYKQLQKKVEDFFETNYHLQGHCN